MELILILGAIWLVGLAYDSIIRRDENSDNSNRSDSRANVRPTHTSPHRPPSRPLKPEQNPQTFRPTTSGHKSSTIKFNPTSSGSTTSSGTAISDLEGLHDAFTGAVLDNDLGLHQCQSCKVYYHTESLQVLREANNSQCVSCQSTNIIAVLVSTETGGGRDYTPNIANLHNYQQYEGTVVTFEGFVHRVNESRRGNDFAVMFEQKSWVKGFKLVFFQGAVRKVGGANYINSLAGKKVKVRGLVINHPRFGYEIIVSEKSMILSVAS